MKALITLCTISSLLLVIAGLTFGDLSSGLVAHYPFNGNADDASGNGNHCTVVGATLTMDRLGNSNGAYAFDGTAAIYTSGTSASFGGMTAGAISAWFRTDYSGTNAITLACVNDYDDCYDYAFLYLHEGRVQFCTRKSDASYIIQVYTNDNTFNDNQWHHAVFDIGSAGNAIYVDGVKQEGVTYTSGNSSTTEYFHNMLGGDYASIGCYKHQTYEGYCFFGEIDEVRIYNRALTDDEIGTLAGAGAPPPPPGECLWEPSGIGIYYGGSVGIGTPTTSGYTLNVGGGIRAYEVVVNTNWSDFVFGDNYPLMSLPQVEQHITVYKHLPGVPSAKEVEANGVSIGEMQSKLLQKIEELTLYTIAQERKLTAQEKRLNALERENAALKAQITD